MDLPTYCVYREIQPDGSVNLAAPLHFFPPLGSDELFDALRSKFPHLKSHSERVGQASMEFFLEEDLSQLPTPLAPSSSSTNVSPWEPSLPSFCSETSAWSSPDAFDPATPHSSPHSHPLSRQQSMATSATAPTNATPPALEQMTSVFTLADYPQPKQHVRRKMTPQEKADYRQRRLAKACDKCAKRKRKCTHTHEGTEVLPLKTAKVVKSNAASLKKSTASKLPKIQDAQDWAVHPTADFGCLPSHDMSSLFDDSALQLHDPSSDLDFDDLLAPLQQQWPWSDTPDWTLLDLTLDTVISAHDRTLQRRESVRPFALFDQPEPTWQNGFAATSSADGENSHGRELTRQPSQPSVNPTLLHNRGSQQDASKTGSPDCQDDIPHVYRKRRPNGHAGVDELRPGSQGLIESAADGRAVQRSPSLAAAANSQPSASALDEWHLLFGPQPEGESHRRDTRNVRGLGLVSAPGSSRGMLQQNSSASVNQTRTLGEGITSNVDPRTQLYMLKRRIPNALHSIVDRNNSGSSVNGGPTLQIHMTAGPTLQVIPREQTSPAQQCVRAEAGVAAGADGPVHTRPRAASVSGFAAGSRTLQQQLTSEERLCDHVRRRDHFGRVLSFGLQAFQAIAGLACLFALWSRFASLDASLSMALLALCIGPALEAKGSKRMRGVTRLLPVLLTA